VADDNERKLFSRTKLNRTVNGQDGRDLKPHAGQEHRAGSCQAYVIGNGQNLRREPGWLRTSPFNVAEHFRILEQRSYISQGNNLKRGFSCSHRARQLFNSLPSVGVASQYGEYL
jgi:hypothetical protein